MRSMFSVRRAIGAGTVVALGFCGSAASGSVRPVVTSSPSSAALIYVSDESHGVVSAYNAKTGTQVEQLTGFSEPEGMTTDSRANLYVADFNMAKVFVFPPAQTSPSLTLAVPNQYPNDVAVSNLGEIAVTSVAPGGASGGPSNVNFYKKGSTSPYASISTPFVQEMLGCAYDTNGNLYVVGIGSAGDPSGGANVVEVTGSGKKKVVKNLFNTDIVSPGSIQVAPNGDYLVLDTAADAVLEFEPSSNVLVGATRIAGASAARWFALEKDGRSLWLLNDIVSGSGAMRYAYPKGGSPKQTVATSNTSYGIALTPAPMP